MKKLYVKPTADSIAYAVNENIAISGDIVTGDPGDVGYQQTGMEQCNLYIANTGVATGVLPGVTNIQAVLTALKLAAEPYKDDPVAYAQTPYMQLQAALFALGPDGYNC